MWGPKTGEPVKQRTFGDRRIGNDVLYILKNLFATGFKYIR